jgi:uncharacterized protein
MSGTAGGVAREQSLIDVPGGRCLVVVDQPTGRTAAATIVLAHGLTGDRVGPAQLLAQLSRQLCEQAGVRVVRFDFRGSGDSPGTFASTTFAGMSSDLVAVVRATCPAGQPLICAGISIGGVPAVMAAHELVHLHQVPVAAVVLMSSDLLEAGRFDVGRVAAIRNGEFHLPGRFFREREAIRPRQLLLEVRAPFLLVYGRRDAKVAAASEWVASHGGNVVAADSDHLFENDSARATLLGAWLTFLDRIAASISGDAEP